METILKFRCDVVKDPTKDELIEVLETTSSHLNDHSNAYYCFTFFLMGHGSQVNFLIHLSFIPVVQ
jgi:hypothetical protein